MRLARLCGLALLLSPLPLTAVLLDVGNARTLPTPVVSSRDGDLYLGEQRLTATPADDSQPDWSPDGRRIVFVRQGSGRPSSSLYLVRRDGGGAERLTGAGQVAIMPAWSPDGQRIAYAASPVTGGSFDIWVLDLPTRRTSRFTTAAGEEVLPAWSRSGKLRYRRLGPGESWAEKVRDTGTPQSGPRELLPDFDQRAPSGLTIQRIDGSWRLGFVSAVDNVGEGPVRIRSSRPSSAQPLMTANQLVELSNGSTRVYRDVGFNRYTIASPHRHWHLMRFDQFELRSADGARLLVRDRKIGFCLADHWGTARERVRGFGPPRFLDNCGQDEPALLSVEQGTSIGYTDRYPANFHGQNLDLTGVPAGVYLLVHRANPTNQLEELDYTNNTASLRIRLSWEGGTPRVSTLRRCEESERC